MNSISETSPEPIYRWVIVSASALMLALSMGMIVNGTSVFFIPLFDEFGWQRGDVSLINTSGLVGLAIGGIFMGRIADKTPIRWVILFGATVIGLCMLGASQADALWQFYLLFFIAGFLGAAALFAPLIANVGQLVQNWCWIGAWYCLCRSGSGPGWHALCACAFNRCFGLARCVNERWRNYACTADITGNVDQATAKNGTAIRCC